MFFGFSIFLEFMNVSQEAPKLCVPPPPFNFVKFLVFWKILNFSSAGKGPFVASKAKNMSQRRTFLGGGSSGVRDMALTSL